MIVRPIPPVPASISVTTVDQWWMMSSATTLKIVGDRGTPCVTHQYPLKERPNYPLVYGSDTNRGRHRRNWSDNHRPGGYLYANYDLVASTQPERLQRVFGILTGLFDRFGLQTNTAKMFGMVCHPCHAPGGMLEEA